MPGKLGHDVMGTAQPREGFGTESGWSELPLGKTTPGQGDQVRMGGMGGSGQGGWGFGGLGIWGQLGSGDEPWGRWGSRETGQLEAVQRFCVAHLRAPSFPMTRLSCRCSSELIPSPPFPLKSGSFQPMQVS